MDKKQKTIDYPLRWDPYVLLKGSEVIDFYKEYLHREKRKILFVLGHGFDIRMNIGLSTLLETSPSLDIQVHLIKFDEGKSSPSVKYAKECERNLESLQKLLKPGQIKVKEIQLWEGTGSRRKRVGDRKVTQLYKSVEDLNVFTDIIVDVSALPRGIYFSLIGKMMTLLDTVASNQAPNFFVLTAENAPLDSAITEVALLDDLIHPFGFSGGLEREGIDKDKVWFPIMGENMEVHVSKANEFINPIEICPVLPFPSKNPRRSDDIFIGAYSSFTNVLRIEPQNMLYVPEQNPFEAYKRLVSEIRKYNETLYAIGGCKAVISCFSSKLLSIGGLLAAFELKGSSTNTGILNIDAQGYEIKGETKPEEFRETSELFLIWLFGEPYQQ